MNYQVDRDKIYRVSSNADVFARGERYFLEGKVNKLTFQSAGSRELVVGKVNGNYRFYEASLLFDPTGVLKGYKCSCESHSIWRGACKHVAAVMFALMEGESDDISAARMTKSARELNDKFELQVFGEIETEFSSPVETPEGSLAIAPSIKLDESGKLSVDFTVGSKRMYVIKNIYEFLSAVQEERVVSYGKKSSFSHSIQNFDPMAVRTIEFLRYEQELYNEVAGEIMKRYNYMPGIRREREIVLSERNLDQFFEIYAGTEISASINEYAGSSVVMTDTAPDVAFDLEFTDNEAVLRGGGQKGMVIHGEKHSYLIREGAFHRVKKNLGDALHALYGVLSDLPEPELRFSGNEMNKFISMTLPRLGSLGLIGQTSGAYSGAAMPECSCKLYLDSDGKHVKCEAVLSSGETNINLLKDDSDALRDAALEYRVKRGLKLYGFQPDIKKGVYVLTGDDSIYDFFSRGVENMKKVSEVYVSEDLQKKISKEKKPSFGVRYSGNLLELTMSNTDFNFSDLMEAMESYSAKKKYHRLKDGRFISFDDGEMDKAMELASAMELSKRDCSKQTARVPAYRALFLDDLTKNDTTVTRNEAFNKLAEDFSGIANKQQADEAVPASLENILRNYQKIGFNWLKMLSRYGFGGILADDMGLGKTLQVITVLLSEPEKTAVIVAPTSLIYNWEKEINRFAPELSPLIISGLPQKRKELIQSSSKILITTYDTLKRDIDQYEGRQFDYIIADEAQNIKNPLTQNAKSLKQLKGGVKFALTGTPIENSLSELWSIFDFIMPGYLYSAHRFLRLYETPIVKDNDKKRAQLLQKQISPFILRRIKSDVLSELPEKTETTLYSDMYPDQKKLYQANLLKARGELDEVMRSGQFAQNKIAILAMLTRLRQICCHPSLFINDYQSGSGKLDLAIETIISAKESGHRLLLFSQFTSMLAILRSNLDDYGITHFYLDGQTPSAKRLEMTERFNNGENDVFLISLKAGGTGLNLTGADVVIHYDPWWNPAVMEQASDRAHRFGQKRAVQVFNIVAKDSIEEKIMLLQSKKKDLIDSVITEGASFINTMSYDEVKELFTGEM